MKKRNAQCDTLKNLRAFRQALTNWFARSMEDHPWRKTRDPWAILVSEIMLQQTTVKAVKAGKRFEKFLAQFPDLEAIAMAEEDVLLKAWEGLGYYNRVRNLQKTAHAVLANWDGQFPHRVEDLKALPGIGDYTAGALASFAFDEPAPIVDGNIARVIARLFDYHETIDAGVGRKQIWLWAGELLDAENARAFNLAIMELGQLICRPKNPSCFECPVADFCRTREPEKLPAKKAKSQNIVVTEHALLARRGKSYLFAKEEGSRRHGFWRLPLRTSDEVADLERMTSIKYAITNHQVTLHLYHCKDKIPRGQLAGEHWLTKEEMADRPLMAPVRKLLCSIMP